MTSRDSPVKLTALTPLKILRSSSKASARTFIVAPSRNLLNKINYCQSPKVIKTAHTNLVSNKNDTALVVITAVALEQS